MDILFQGNIQKEQGTQQALSYTTSYASFFNLSATPAAPIVPLDSQTCYKILLEEKNQDPTFVRTVFIKMPTVDNVPESCLDLENEFKSQVNLLFDELQDAADMGSFLLNPKYDPAGNMIDYFCCQNVVFTVQCSP